jgi:hypothetical protein
MVGLDIHLVVVNLYVHFQRRNLVRRQLCHSTTCLLILCVVFSPEFLR